ncbi:MAG: hypothetical protein LBP37_04065 [Spirochaetaceae bacterium]|jgi:hypothetical protein|nr:hypothetical protein [Spirochaetaceae bacterium]
MKTVVEVEASIDRAKMDAVKEKLRMIVGAVNSGMPQINKNRRIKNIVKMVERDIAEIISVTYREVTNG